MNTFHNRKILVVDDEVLIREIIKDEFSYEGATVYEAENGKAALDVLRAHSEIDVVISDVRMPGGDGTGLLNNIRTGLATQPLVVFVSAFSDLSVAQAFARGAEASFPKPFDLSKLLEKVTALLEPIEKRLSTPPMGRATVEIVRRLPNISGALSNGILALGRGGLCLREQAPLKAGDLCSLALEFEAGAVSKIAGQGIVRWTEKDVQADQAPMAGIEFSYLHDSIRPQVLNYLGTIAPRPFIPDSL